VKFSLDRLKNNPHLCSPQLRKGNPEKDEENQAKRDPENKKNKIWELKKGSYLCTPETNEGNFGKEKGKADHDGKRKLKRESRR
jgi:hypothetical protein